MLQLARGHQFEGKYTILKELGRGGFGTVYKAQQQGMDRYVAIKILTVDQMQGEAALTARERFLREVRIISKLRHPNTVTIHDFGQTRDNDLVYMVLEYVDGETLKQLVVRRGALEEKRAIHIAHQIARSLSEAHRHGIIHRDLKPQNIMLTELGGEQDFVKVLDFGIARFRNKDDGKDLTNTGNPEERELIGTPRYMSPEQVRGEDLTGASDVYSLGLMCYEMLTGQPAVQGNSMMALITQQVSQDPLNLPFVHNFHPLIQQIILKATHKNLHMRYRTVDLLAAELEQALMELKRERSSNSTDFLMSHQYDPSPHGLRQTGPHTSLPLQSHHYNATHTPSGQHYVPSHDPMGPLLTHNAPPQTGRHQAVPPMHEPTPGEPIKNVFGFADEQAETNLQLEPLHPSQLQNPHMFQGNQTPAAQPAPPPQQPSAMPAAASQSFPPSTQMPPLPSNGPSPFEMTQSGGIQRPITNSMPALHPDDEEADTSYVLTLLLTAALAIALVVMTYTTFLMVGAAVGALFEGFYRLATTVVIMLLLLVLPLFTELGRRERFHIVYPTLHRIKRVVSIGLGLTIGTCLLISLTLPDKVLVRLEGTPNWFFDSPNEESGLQYHNATYSQKLAGAMRTTLGSLGMLDETPVDVTPPNTPPPPTRPRQQTQQPPPRLRTSPAPTRPATIKKQQEQGKTTDGAPKSKDSRDKKSASPPTPKKPGGAGYESWD